MYLVRLIYCSTPTSELSLEDIPRIVEKSIENNKKTGITGMLCYDSTFFLQWIEGPRSAINALYATLIGDSRHTNLVILDYSMVGSRQFAHWNMACVCSSDVDEETTLKYVISEAFNPYVMTGDGARSFLLEIAAAKENRQKSVPTCDDSA